MLTKRLASAAAATATAAVAAVAAVTVATVVTTTTTTATATATATAMMAGRWRDIAIRPRLGERNNLHVSGVDGRRRLP